MAERHYLLTSDVLADGTLEASAQLAVTDAAENLRIAAVAARMAALVQEFRKGAIAAGATVVNEPGRIVRAIRQNGEHFVAIPALGVPSADVYHDAHDAAEALGAAGPVLLYDHTGLLNSWARHLEWLDDYLPIKGMRVTETKRRLRP